MILQFLGARSGKKAKAGAGGCRGHLRSHSVALHTWAKADPTFPSHMPGQAAQLNADSTNMETPH